MSVTTQQHAPSSRMRPTVWRGRASDRRRQQVTERAVALVPDVPTGPVDRERREARTAPDTRSAVDAVWRSLADVLDAVRGESSALLCTPSGFPLKAYGYQHTELVLAARTAARSFELRRSASGPDADLVLVETNGAMTQTVIIAIRTSLGDHLLTVTADDVSQQVLRAWTRHVADQLRAVLAHA